MLTQGIVNAGASRYRTKSENANLLFPGFSLCFVQDAPLSNRNLMSQGKPEAEGVRKTSSEDRIDELEAENIRLRRLVAELLFKNQRLRSAHLDDEMVSSSSD